MNSNPLMCGFMEDAVQRKSKLQLEIDEVKKRRFYETGFAAQSYSEPSSKKFKYTNEQT